MLNEPDIEGVAKDDGLWEDEGDDDDEENSILMSAHKSVSSSMMDVEMDDGVDVGTTGQGWESTKCNKEGSRLEYTKSFPSTQHDILMFLPLYHTYIIVAIYRPFSIATHLRYKQGTSTLAD